MKNYCSSCEYSKYTYSKILQARVHECRYKGDSACARRGRKKNAQKKQLV